MEIYVLIAGIILMILGFLMIFRWIDFLLIRYESFQKFVRKKELRANKNALSKFYSITFFALSIPLIIGAIIGLLNSEISDMFYVWLMVGIAAVGIITILYCNISTRFIVYDSTS